jgi:altronate hydrolase
VRTVRSQQVSDEYEAGLEAVEELFEICGADKRERCSAADLVIGVKCGGSDGFSGLTANPMVGRITDRVTAAGGAAILTEIPEIFGAEKPLMTRCASRDVFDELVSVVNDFKSYFISHNQPIYENPSPGNIEGGITTLEEKSLGAAQKAGTQCVVADVIRYGDCAVNKGLTILEAPGNDAVSSTALTAAGATLILFTTGRGTPLGFPAPTIKISSNSALAGQKPRWIDFNAGAVLDGEAADEVASALWRKVLDVASGAPSRNEENDERSIAIWKRGVTL